MTKSIKYGSLVASLTMAAFVLGAATPVSAATTVDNTSCAVTASSADASSVVAGEYDTVAAYKKDLAKDYTAQATCYSDNASAVADEIVAKNADFLNYDASEITGSDTVIKDVKRDAEEVVRNYGAVNDETLLANLGKGSQNPLNAYNVAKQALIDASGVDDFVPTDAAILAEIKSDAATYDAEAEIAAYNEAKAASEIVTLANKYIALKAAEKTATNTAATLEKEADAATAVDAAQDADEEADKAIAKAQSAINELDKSTAIAKELQAALDAVSDGEVTAADEDAVQKAADDADALKAETASRLNDAKTEANTAKNSADLDDDNMSLLDNDTAKSSAKRIVDEYKADTGISEFDDDSYKKALGKGSSATAENPWNKAVATLEEDDAVLTYDDDDVLAVIEGDKATYGAEDAIAAYKKAAAAQKVVELLDALRDAQDADDAAADAVKAAGFVKDVLPLAKAAETAIDDAQTAIDALGATDPFATELEAVLDAADNSKDSTNNSGSNSGENGSETAYSYTLLDGANQTYNGSALSFRFDAPVADLLGVYLDGVRLTSGYTVKSGSTIITLSDELLATLGAGEHTLLARFVGDKDATVTFTVASATDNGKGATGTTTKGTKVTPNTGAFTAEAKGASANSLVAAIAAVAAAFTVAGAAVMSKLFRK